MPLDVVAIPTSGLVAELERLLDARRRVILATEAPASRGGPARSAAALTCGFEQLRAETERLLGRLEVLLQPEARPVR